MQPRQDTEDYDVEKAWYDALNIDEDYVGVASAAAATATSSAAPPPPVLPPPHPVVHSAAPASAATATSSGAPVLPPPDSQPRRPKATISKKRGGRHLDYYNALYGRKGQKGKGKGKGQAATKGKE